jgi:hypothetical protein
MDKFDRSHSEGTYRLMRAEHLAVVVACSVLALMHWQELDFWRFAAVFILIDAAGYVPGLVAYLRAGHGPVARGYHYAYNILHSYLTWWVVVLAWASISGWEWAMLAVPIHLSGDRGIFGNVFKPVGRPFEPTPPARDVKEGAWN